MYVYHTIYEALNMKASSIKRKDFPKEYYKLEDPSCKTVKRTVTEFKVCWSLLVFVFGCCFQFPNPNSAHLLNILMSSKS